MSGLQNPEILLQMGALLGMAAFCVYHGSKRSNLKDEDAESETISSDEALKVPLFASATLFGIYMLFKLVDPAWLTVIMTAYFALIGTTCVQFAFDPLVKVCFKPLIKNVADKVKFTMQDGDSEPFKLFTMTRADIIGLIFGAIVSAAYVYTKHWILTNFIAMSIVIGALQIVKIDSFKTGAILLSGLFLYDIFWVFGTDVMVTVSKSVNGPIKVLFPQDIVTNGINSESLGMLGLGDIMMPGVMVAMLYRWDMKRGNGHPDAPTPYFNAAMVMYVVGLIITFIVLHVAGHAQPALLYLSPIGVLTPLIQAWFRGEVKGLMEAGEEEEKEDKKKE